MNRNLHLLVLFGLVGVSFGLSIFQLHNDDAGFHVANGMWVLEYGEIPLKNPFSFAEDGVLWTQHQWLSAAWMAWVATAFGVQGLIVWKALLVATIFGALGVGLRRLPTPWVFVFGSLAIAASAYRFVERPFLITLLFVAITGVSLVEWRVSRRKGVLGLAAAMTVVSFHFHAGGMYALLLWGAFGADAGLSWLLRKEGVSRRESGLEMGWSLGVLCASVLSLMLLAPSGLDVILLPLNFSHHEYWNAHLGEFRPMPLHWAAFSQWLLIGSAGVAAAWCAWRRDFFSLLVLLGFGFLALKHARMIFPLAVVMLVVAGGMDRLSKLPRIWVILGVLLAGFSLVDASANQAGRYEMGLGTDGIDRSRHSVELMAQAAEMPGETFVSDGLAGMWLWSVFDGSQEERVKQRRVLIHNCLECYEETTYIDLYQWIRYGKPGWEEKVERLGIRSFLLKYTTPGERKMQEGKPNVRHALFQSDEWVLVNFDDVAALYVAREALPKGTPYLDSIGGGFPVDPDSWKPLASDTPWSALKEALSAHSESNPTQVRALLILGQLGSQVSDWETVANAARQITSRKPGGPEAKALRGLLKRGLSP